MEVNDFEKIKNTVLPYFIQFYGDDYAEVIIERINKIIPFFYWSYDSLSADMHSDLFSKRNELTIKFLRGFDFDIPEEILNEVINEDSVSCLKQCKDANDFLSACFGGRQYSPNSNDIKNFLDNPREEHKIQSFIKCLKLLGINIEEENYEDWLQSEDYNIVVAKLRRIQEQIDKIDLEYNSYEKKYESLKEKISQNLTFKYNVEQQKFIEFLTSIEKYMVESDRQLFENYKKSDNKTWFSFYPYLNIIKITGNSFTADSCLNAFTLEADEALISGYTTSFKKNMIMDQRLEYFKYLGIYKEGMDKNEFLKSDLARDNWPDVEMVNDILEKRKHYNDLADDVVIKASSSYLSDNERLKNLRLSDPIEFTVKRYKEKSNSITPTTIEKDGSLESVALLFFNSKGSLPRYTDIGLVHEINHALELTFLGKNDKGQFVYKSGFDIVTNSDDEDTETKREYELISETFNQMVAIAVTDAMHQDGVYLFDDPKTAKITGGVTYEHSIKFIRGFWDEYREVIKQARMYDMQILYDSIGKENFDKLNRVVNEYNSMPYYALMNDIINKADTPLTQQFYRLLGESKTILKEMNTYQNENELAKKTA